MQKFKDQIDEKYFNFYKIFINRNFQTPIKASNIWQNALSYIQLTSASFPSRVVMRERRILKIIKTKLQRDIKWIKSIISIKLFIVRRCGILTYYDLHLYNLYNGPPPLCLDNYWTLDRSSDSHHVTSLHLRIILQIILINRDEFSWSTEERCLPAPLLHSDQSDGE